MKTNSNSKPELTDSMINLFYDRKSRKFMFENQLKFFPINLFLDMLLKNDEIRTNLFELDISHNSFIGVIDWNKISQFTNLKILIASNNLFFSQQIDWKSFSKLSKLDLSFNPHIHGDLVWNEIPRNIKELDIDRTAINVNMEWDAIKKTNLKEFCVEKQVALETIRKLPSGWSIRFGSKYNDNGTRYFISFKRTWY